MKTINLKKIASEFDPGWGKFPRTALLSVLGWIIRQRKINKICKRSQHYKNLDFINEVIRHLGFRAEMKGEENLPESGNVIFVSNHPLGGPDGLLLIQHLGRFYPNLRVVANELLQRFEPIKEMIYPVKINAINYEMLENMEDGCAQGIPLITFPAGLCSRYNKKEKRLIDPPWNGSFINIAKKHGSLIVPIFFSGKNSRGFYNWSLLRQRLGIKKNIERILLSREMFNKKGKKFQIQIGKSFDLNNFPEGTKRREIVRTVRDAVYAME